MELTERAARFPAEYVKDRNGAAAARRAGYAAKGAKVEAVRLLKDPRIRKMIAILEPIDLAKPQSLSREFITLRLMVMVDDPKVSEKGKLEAFKQLKSFLDHRSPGNIAAAVAHEEKAAAVAAVAAEDDEGMGALMNAVRH